MWWGRQAGSLHQGSLAEGPGGLRAVTSAFCLLRPPQERTCCSLKLVTLHPFLRPTERPTEHPAATLLCSVSISGSHQDPP